MMKTVAFFKKVLIFVLCFTVVSVSALGVSLKTQAAASLVVSATVNGSAVNVTVAFPDVSFAAATVDVSFNPAHLELSAKGTTAGLTHGMITISEAANANAAGKCTFAIMNFAGNLSAKGGTLNLVFAIKDATVETTSLTVTVVNCGDTSANPIELGGTSANLTLKTVTPPPPPPVSSDTSGSGSSGTTDEGGTPDSSVSSEKPVSSGNSDSSGTSDTPNSGSSSKPVSSEKTSSKVPSDTQTSDTGTVTDSPTVSDTESETLTSETDAITDTTDSDLSQGSDTSLPSASSNTASVPLGTQVIRTEGNGNDGISTDTVVLLVSLAVACFLCFCLTYLGLRRQAPKNPEEE